MAESSNTASESKIQSESAIQSESDIQSTPFKVEKKTYQEVKSQAAEHKTSALTPGLAEHPEQTHTSKQDSAATMGETLKNIYDGWNSDSVDKTEAETPMGSMTVKSIEKEIDLYACGICGECNSRRRETCKKCKEKLGGVRW